MNKILKFKIIILLLTFIACSRQANNIQNEVHKIMQKYEQGEFVQDDSPKQSGGPSFGLKKGKLLTRDILIPQTMKIVSLGNEAVPELLKWLSHDEAYIRFIAAQSLKNITGEDPTFYYFGTPGEKFNNNELWFENSVKVWTSWYENNKK